MRVGIQAFLWGQAGTYRQSGVSNYIRHLVRGLAGLSTTDEFLAYLPSADARSDLPPSSHLQARPSPLPLHRPALRIAWEHSAFPLLLWRDRVDLLHATMNVAPWWVPCPTVVTVHDLAYMRYPHVHPWGRRVYLTLMTRLTLRRARAIVAVSQHTRQEIVDLLSVPPHRIHVLYEGVDADYAPLPAAAVEAFRRRHSLPRRYLLYVGNLEPRKNLPHLIRAFSRVAAEEPELALVLVGAQGWGYDAIFAQITALGLAERVLFPGFVPREELPLWYNGAEAFCYPSFYEGFGLPPLEAMACGTPVVVSTASSLPEVVGEAGLQVAPDDEQGLAAALLRLVRDADLRQELSGRGRERARRFSWQRMAQQTADLYRRLMEG